MTTPKPNVDGIIAKMEWPTVSGGTASFGGDRDRWSMLFVYRGKHCPRCKRFLNKLNANLAAWTDVLDVVVVSADPKEKAVADMEEFGWDFDLAYGMSEDQMRALGLYVTDPLSDAETDRRFAEPGAFGVRPNGTLNLVAISNGPAARPDLDELLDGMIFNITNDRPTRGLAH